MEASPAAAFIVTEAEFLLKLPVVPLDARVQSAMSTRLASATSCGRLESDMMGSLSPPAGWLPQPMRPQYVQQPQQAPAPQGGFLSQLPPNGNNGGTNGGGSSW